MAEHNYHDVHKMFTPAFLMVVNQCQGYNCGVVTSNCPTCCHYASTGAYNDWNFHSWLSWLLPFMEANSVYNKIDENSPLFSPATIAKVCQSWTYKNSGCPTCDACAAIRPVASVIPTFVCPSAPRKNNPFVEHMQFVGGCCFCAPCCFGPSRLVGASDYGGANGYRDGVVCWYRHNGGKDCFFKYPRCGVLVCPKQPFHAAQGGISIEQIIDGTSTTILTLEMAGRPDLWRRGQSVPISANQCGLTGSNPGGCWACWNNGAQWIVGSNFDGTRAPFVTHSKPVCFFNCANQAGYNFIYSFHPGAGGVALCDGSARMLSENVSVLVMVNLFTFAGNQKVLDSQF